MLESEHWAVVRKKLHPEIHVTRIENSAIAGVSDVSMCRRGVERWVELKVRKGNFLQFRSSQPVWIRKRMAAGGVVWVLSREGGDVVLYHGLVCCGTQEQPPVPVKGQKAVRVHVKDSLYERLRLQVADMNRGAWQLLEDRIFGGNQR